MATASEGVAMRRFVLAELPATPWRNGGGQTREIACLPAGAGVVDFDWRLSVATIEANGPFSPFPGVDRVITLLEGDGVILRSPDGLIEHALTEPLVPFAFSGDVALDCELVGVCRDFNVMTRRASTRAEVRVVRAAHEIAPAPGGACYAAAGTWEIDAGDGMPAQVFAAGEGGWWMNGIAGWRLRPRSADAAMLTVRFTPV